LQYGKNGHPRLTKQPERFETAEESARGKTECHA
jgi:hypothetical protein